MARRARTILIPEALDARVEEIRAQVSAALGRPIPRTAIFVNLLKAALDGVPRDPVKAARAAAARAPLPPAEAARAERVRREREAEKRRADGAREAWERLEALKRSRRIDLSAFIRMLRDAGLEIAPPQIYRFWSEGAVDGVKDVDGLLALVAKL